MCPWAKERQVKTASDSVLKQIADLQNLSYEELRQQWLTLYGKEPSASNKPYLMKRLAYRIQENAYGGLPGRARKIMDDILDAHGFDENGGCLDGRRTEKKRKVDVPVVGTRLMREWNGHTYEVTVVHRGFEHEGRRYRSLSAIATAITGTHWNGRSFFGLEKSHEKRRRDAV